MTLEGGERLVLKTLRDLQGDTGDYVDDARLAAATKMFVEDVRNWLATLEDKGFVGRARVTYGFSAYVTPMGKLELSKLELRRTEPIPFTERLNNALREEEHRPRAPAPEPPTPKGVRDLIELFQMPEVWNKVVMFKEVFRSACTQIERVSEFKMLHDKLQELQNRLPEHRPSPEAGGGLGRAGLG